MNITADMLAAIIRRHITMDGLDAGAVVGRIAAEIRAIERVAKRRAEIGATIAAERGRHDAEMLRLVRSMDELQASCPHPATEVHRGALAGESHRECVLCGAEIQGK